MENNNYLKQAIKIVEELIKSEDNVDDNIISFLLDSNKNTQYTPEFMKNLCGEKISNNNLSGFTLLHKCVILTAKYPNLNNILRNYFNVCSEFHDSINITTKEGASALLLASRNSKTNSTEETVKLLIDAGSNVNLQANDGCTALLLASIYSKNKSTERTVKLLIDAGANVNLQCNGGLSALHLASRNSRTKSTEGTIKLLIDAGANVNLQDNYGQSALHLASKYSGTKSTEETVKLLVDTGANVNLQNNNGWSALHFASRYLETKSTEETLVILVLNGANINLKNNNNKTPIDLLPNGFEKIKNMFTMINKQKKYNKIISECVICFGELESFTCNYNHNVCFECLVRSKNKFCPICFRRFKLLQTTDNCFIL